MYQFPIDHNRDTRNPASVFIKLSIRFCNPLPKKNDNEKIINSPKSIKGKLIREEKGMSEC